MIFDLLLDQNTHDLVFDDSGFIELAEDAVCVAQKVEVRLSTRLGEWLFDLSMGINFDRVFTKAPDLRVVRSLYVVEIDAVDEVTAIRSLELSVDPATRFMTLTFDVPGVERVVAIDVMNSIEQEMIVSHKNGTLVLENAMLMDYPIIFWLKGNGSD